MITDIPDGKNTGSFLSISSSTNVSLNNVQILADEKRLI